LGVGLSAACGFRIFVPLLIMSIASLSGQLVLSPEFDWIATYPALAAFSIATLFEVAAYYIPWADNLLDTIAVPAATVSEMSPFLQWGLAVIVGGGVAGTVQGFTSITRIASTVTTGGLGNPVVSTVEAGGSIVMSILAITLPVVAVIAVGVIIFFAFRKIYGWLSRRNKLQTQNE
jgi:hypothetical protein